jgi:DNA-binding MarR family transcriptional regulator
VTNPTAGLTDIVHQRHRLAILTVAAEADQVEFGYLKDTLDLTAGNLNRHLAVLHDAGLIAIKKGYNGSRPKTWIKISRAGRRELAAEVHALQELVNRHQLSSSAETVSRLAPKNA